MFAPYLLGLRGPGAAGAGDGDGFVDQPVVTTTTSGDTTIKGKVKAGSFGKFVVPLATVQAGRQYTFRYTPQFAQLAQQGKLAMVGFGFKTNNDFHIAGLRGDGSTGLHKYQVYGTPPNGWNVQTGHTTNDGGAAASGTQTGPNYLRLITSADGTTYTLKSSVNGTTWNTEFTGQTPSPFSNVSGVATFGVALWFNNADAGPFSITIDQFADVVAPVDIGSYIGSPAAQTPNSSSYTFTINTGTAAANRVTPVVIFWENSTSVRTLTGVTIDNGDGSGAHAMNIAAQQGGAAQGACAIVWLANTFGTTATIVVSFSGSALACQVASYRVLTANPTPLDSGANTGASPVTIADIEVKSGGFLIVAIAGNTNTDCAASYNGADTLATDLSGSTRLETSSCPIGSFSINTTENSTTNDPGATTGGTNPKVVAVSWQA
ncbi:hypothetical protein [Mesorhizobium silamurunense]|uniref:hypothetical protein n=1 Tax=Mesorhizobium silamurunense TaxID=499528 RepID=UPI00177FA0FC|nr:hypothetical protein [Mesorhizobium silamurunense]